MTQIDDPKALAVACAEEMYSTDAAAKQLGISIVNIGPGTAVLSMTVKESMVNGHDICHGGMTFSLADTCFAYACNSDNHAAVAASCTIEYLAPAYLNDVLTATANREHQGGRSGIYDIAVTNQNNQIVALFRGRSARIKRPVLPESPAQ